MFGGDPGPRPYRVADAAAARPVAARTTQEIAVGTRVLPARGGRLSIGMDDPSLAPRLRATALHGSPRSPRLVLTYRVVAPESDPPAAISPVPEGPASLRESPLHPAPPTHLDSLEIRRPEPASVGEAASPPATPTAVEFGGSSPRAAGGDLATAAAIGLLAGVAVWFFTAGTGLDGWPRWATAGAAAVLCAWGGLRWIAPPR